MISSKSSATTEQGIQETRNNEIILKVEGVSKKFSYSLRDVLKYGTKRLFREFLGLPSRTERLERGEFWALDEVSFELGRGQTLGIIGRNGAGKSSLLKIINGIFLPDRGRVAIKGTAAGLIEIGAGFQPNLTGRENIYVIASILGMTKQQVDAVFDDIIEFADIGRFIDSPVQGYSSGMIVRLGFAIHVFQKPDLLLVDEILAVGDFEFQQKCLEKITAMKQEMGMILVSHSMPTIARFCDRVILLNRGKIVLDGSPNEAVARMTLVGGRGSDEIEGESKRSSLEEPDDVVDQSSVVSFSGKRIVKALFGPEDPIRQDRRRLLAMVFRRPTDSGDVLEVFSEARLAISFSVKFPDAKLIIGVPIFLLTAR